MKLKRNIFVSYTHDDRKAADRLVAALSKMLPSNIQFVRDTAAVLPGDDLLVKTAEALSQTDALIVLISRASSSSNWIRSEVSWALAQQEGSFPIFPVLIDSENTIPYLLRTRVHINLSNNDDFSQNIELLAEAILRSFQEADSGTAIREYGSNSPDFDITFSEGLASIGLIKSKIDQENALIESRMKFSIALTAVLFTTMIIPAIFISLKNMDLRELFLVISTPMTGLIGIVLGFYFGERSSRNNKTNRFS